MNSYFERRRRLSAAVVCSVTAIGFLSGCSGPTTLLANGPSSLFGSHPHHHERLHIAGRHHRRLKVHAQRIHRNYAPVANRSRREYALAIVPVLDQSGRQFDQVVRAVVASPDLQTVGPACQMFGDQVTAAGQSFDGVPHPHVWYSPVGQLHHSIMGIYNSMSGALVACQTAVDNGDSGALSIATSDMTDATAALHRTDQYVRWLSYHR